MSATENLDNDGAGVETFRMEGRAARTGAALVISNVQKATAWKDRAATLYVNGEARGDVTLDGVRFFGAGDILPGPFANLNDAAISTLAYFG